MRSKIREWLGRYLPAEIYAFVGSLAAAYSAQYFFGNIVVTAIAATWGDTIFYYARILFVDMQVRRKRDEKISIVGFLKVLRNEVVEFGSAEYLDSFFIRPLAIFVALKVTENLPLGLFLGKIGADVTFYIPTIFGYEIRKKYFRD